MKIFRKISLFVAVVFLCLFDAQGWGNQTKSFMSDNHGTCNMILGEWEETKNMYNPNDTVFQVGFGQVGKVGDHDRCISRRDAITVRKVSGNVGIHQADPKSELDVNGTIRARAIEICDETGASCNDFYHWDCSEKFYKDEKGLDVLSWGKFNGKSSGIVRGDHDYYMGDVFNFQNGKVYLNRLFANNQEIEVTGDVKVSGSICGAGGCIGDASVPSGTFCGFCKSGKTEIACANRKVCNNDCAEGWTERELFGGHSACVKD